jgi:hypothetical protein
MSRRSPVDGKFRFRLGSQSTIGCRMTGGAETCHSQSIRMSDRCTNWSRQSLVQSGCDKTQRAVQRQLSRPVNGDYRP